jgi:aquaporin TIP
VDGTGRAAVAELVATFAFVLVAAGAATTAGFGLDLTGVALASGLALAAMVSVAARWSGGMVNPAVAVGLWIAGRLSGPRAAVLVLAQILGAVAAGYLLRYVVPGTAFDVAAGGTPALASGVASGKGIVVEAAATFVLVFAWFGTLADHRGPPSRAAGLTVGLVLAAGIMAFGPYTGAAANPARWFGPALASGVWSDWFVWIVGPLAGGVIAAALYAAAFLRGVEPDTP